MFKLNIEWDILPHNTLETIANRLDEYYYPFPVTSKFDG